MRASVCQISENRARKDDKETRSFKTSSPSLRASITGSMSSAYPCRVCSSGGVHETTSHGLIPQPSKCRKSELQGGAIEARIAAIPFIRVPFYLLFIMLFLRAPSYNYTRTTYYNMRLQNEE